MKADLIAEVPTGDCLGEGLVWDHRLGAFLWTDIHGKRMHAWTLATGALDTLPLDHKLCSFGLTRDPDRLVAAFAQGFAWLDRRTGAIDWIRQYAFAPGIRFNDGRVGPQGRFWAGTLLPEDMPDAQKRNGVMFCLHPNLKVSEPFAGFQISNGLCWCPLTPTLYHADSPTGRITRRPVDSDGTTGVWEPFIDMPAGEFPDGGITDAAGNYWSSVWEGSAIAGFTPQGRQFARIPLPVSLVTCPAFGGPDLNILATTSAWVDLDPDRRRTETSAGNLFVFETDQTGLLSAIFGGTPP